MTFTDEERRAFIGGYVDAMQWANTTARVGLAEGGGDRCAQCGKPIEPTDTGDWTADEPASNVECVHYPEETSFDAITDIRVWSFDHDSMVRIEEVCDDFMRATEPMLRAATMISRHLHPITGPRDMSYHGHDLALTQNHHGTGFWDRGYPSALGDALTDAAHAQGEAYAYVSDEAQGLLVYEG